MPRQEQDFASFLTSSNKWILHLLFFRIPKNASTSIYEHLGAWNLINKHQNLIRAKADQRIYKNVFDATHAKPDEVHAALGREMEKYFSFCVVRNPWDRVVSMYYFAMNKNLHQLYGIDKKISFEDFCGILLENKNNPYFIASHKQIEWTRGKLAPIAILRFESLREDFSQMLRNHGITHIHPDIPRLNVTDGRKSYREVFTGKTKNMIAEIFEEDIDNFKYVF